MSKLTCPIVRDLLPLYIDQVVSPETAQAVEDHLGDCPDCRREYETLKVDLPETTAEEADTSRQFGDMMKRFKRNQKLKDGLTIALLLALLLAIFLWQPPQVNDNEGVTIYRVFPIEDENMGPSFLFLYSAPLYDGSCGSTAGVREKDGKRVLQIDFQRKLLRKKLDFYLDSTTYYPGSDVDEVHLGDEVIWTKEANGDDPIPEYVEVLQSEEWSTFTIELDGKENFTDYPAPFIWVNYKDGREIVWDLDGNVLRESP